jgi:hypothetical protein
MVAALAACGGPRKTVVVVSLTAMPARADARQVDITVGNVHRTFQAPAGLSDTAPVKFGVFIADDVSGQVPVQVTAKGSMPCETLEGAQTASVPANSHGAVIQVDVVVKPACGGGDGGGADTRTGSDGAGGSPGADAPRADATTTPDAGVPADAPAPGADGRDAPATTPDAPREAAPPDMPPPPPDMAVPVLPPSLTKCKEYDHSPLMCDDAKGINDFAVSTVAFSPDGKLFVSAADDGRIKLWNVAGSMISAEGRVITNTGLARVGFSPDGATLAVGGDMGELFLYDMKANARTPLTGHMDRLRGVAFSRDGTRLVTMDRGKVLKVWDVATHAALRTVMLPAEPYSFALAQTNPAGQLWAAVGMLKADMAPPTDAGAMFADAAYVWLADVNNPNAPVFIKGDSSYVNAVAFSPDGKLLWVGGDDGDAVPWDVSNKPGVVAGMALPRSKDNAGNVRGVQALAPSPDGKYVLAVYAGWRLGGVLRVWDIAQKIVRNEAQPDSYYPTSGAWSPAGNAVGAGEIACGKVYFCQD